MGRRAQRYTWQVDRPAKNPQGDWSAKRLMLDGDT
jgi:hypothetical protein